MPPDQLQVILINSKLRPVLDVDILRIEVFKLRLVDFGEDRLVVRPGIFVIIIIVIVNGRRGLGCWFFVFVFAFFFGGDSTRRVCRFRTRRHCLSTRL
ncbi:hypothetical protein BDV25DRAFT_147613 [Aspergillus avenaceus]|uniref:Uncharacterized protein n=1 Tax=Aspergillus avenaceus TaxID=36643 RepID=A0A5N6U702_ASPAV|nr:hypothetical protein BDV25DRAFT_147613 [Aspergillus avenaceus]